MQQLQAVAVRRSRWHKKVIESVRCNTAYMCEELDLARLYPVVPKYIGNGEYVNTQSVLPFQRMMHEGQSLNGRKAHVVALVGGVGSGKSVSLLVQAHYLCLKYPGYQIMYVMPYDYYFWMYFKPLLDQVIDPENNPHVKKFNGKEQKVYYRNGSSIICKGFESAESIRMFGVHAVFYEEITQLCDCDQQKARAVYKTMFQRMRARPVHYPYLVYLATNPAGLDWVYEELVIRSPYKDSPHTILIPPCDKYIENASLPPAQRLDGMELEGVCNKCGLTCQKDCRYYPLTGAEIECYEYVLEDSVTDEGSQTIFTLSIDTQNNPFNPKSFVATMANQYRNDPLMYQAMVKGKFTQSRSLGFSPPFYREEVHILTWQEIAEAYGWDPGGSWPTFWQALVGIDPGGTTSQYAALLLLHDVENGYMFAVDQVYEANITWDKFCRNILDMTAPYDRVSYYIDCHAATAKSGAAATVESIGDRLREHNIVAELARGYSKKAGLDAAINLLDPDLLTEHPFRSDKVFEENGVTKYMLGSSRLWIQGDEGGGVLGAPDLINEMRRWRRKPTRKRIVRAADADLVSQRPEEPFVDAFDHLITSLFFVLLTYQPMRHRPPQRGGRSPKILPYTNLMD